MPKEPRAIAVGFPHHIVQRGNNRQIIFFDREDRNQYLRLLETFSRKWQAPLLAYCLMDNHVHLLAKAKKENSLPKMMQVVALCYTQYINVKYQRTGRLWEARYYSCIVGDEPYLWAAARYIEQNPRRAGIAQRDEDYPYSSARAHIMGERDSILGEALFDERQRGDYVRLISESLTQEDIDRLRSATRARKLFGNDLLTKRLEKKLGRKLALTSQDKSLVDKSLQKFNGTRSH